MRRPVLSTRARLSLAILLAGLTIGLSVPEERFADASTYVLMTDSLWNDGDLVYTPQDYARAVALHFRDVPAGLFLTRHDWGYGYGKPFVYPAIAMPFYALLGPRGFFVLNGLLLAALVLLGADILSHRIGWERGVAVAAAVNGFSVTPAYVDWIDPFLMCSVLAAAALAAYRRARPACSAVLLVALAACRPPYVALAAAPVALYAMGRDWRRLTRLVVAALTAAAVCIAVARAAGEAWTPYAAQRFYYLSAFPYDGGDAADREQGIPVDNPVHDAHWPDSREFAETTKGFFVGRFAGVLVYFPGLVACALWSRRWDREKLAWALALLGACAAIVIAFPHNYFGGSHAIGNRLFTLLPIAFVFVDFVAWRPWRVLATAALAALVLPVMRTSIYLSHHPGLQMAWAPYRHLPLEWTHVRQMQPPFPYPGMAAFTDNQYGWEGTGVWTRGGTTAAFVFVRPPGQHPRVRLLSPLADVRISDGGAPVPWRPGSIDIELTRAVATTHDRISDKGEAAVYVLAVTTDSVFRPRADGASADNRYLGVFVQPLDTAPPHENTPAGPNQVRPWWEPRAP